MEEKEFTAKFQEKVHEDLYSHLVKAGAIDKQLPECPDVEGKWKEICGAYLPDGTREFQEYPVSSLGWMMLMGMAMAWYWDTDWIKYGPQADLYQQLRDKAGYDNFDDTVVSLLGYEGEKAEKILAEVADCASRVYSLLTHSHIEPSTKEAFQCYIAALRQLYLMGMCVELKALGYRMTPLEHFSPN